MRWLHIRKSHPDEEYDDESNKDPEPTSEDEHQDAIEKIAEMQDREAAGSSKNVDVTESDAVNISVTVS